MQNKIIVMFQKDFRLYDNPALFEAAQSGEVVPVYVQDETFSIGSASKWWLHHAIIDVQKQLEALGSTLIIRKGNTQEEILSLIDQLGITAVYWNICYDPDRLQSNQKMKMMLEGKGIVCKEFNSYLLLEPWIIKKKDNTEYKVFTPFYNVFQKQVIPKPISKVQNIKGESSLTLSLSVSELHLLPTIPWTSHIESIWEPTEEGAYKTCKKFFSSKLASYSEGRDFPNENAHSMLAAYLSFGQISVRWMYHYLINKSTERQCSLFEKQVNSFIRQLIWREFSYYLLYHYPFTVYKPLNKSFEHFPWNNDEELLTVWQKGKTGYPFIDAGMRELWQTGFMHNRARMAVASFLVKHLLIPWQEGAKWFMDTLLDADIANNTMGWQWVAGSGADASPYFRIFNPITQGEKFDKDGEYIRKWVPELRNIPNKYIHKPWEAPEHILQKANITLGHTYPLPIVDHKAARERALCAYKSMKEFV
ncbi:cryptochrome/photolyase family protein [Bacillus mobilis]|uniref:cryptochrome/photolyase family protein n=1 Tax=Bacillus mobilis TaxID=2026190 RepID=UPI000A302A3D|nr:deoxyribodipyrimidine photo-lyase [Bacillus mobilis]MCU5592481.1 DNA photolyase family protein [Bacillus mobilis]MCU5739285.1 DNA photolyase family protein [Bacillus mobilis]MCU9561135.1 DNA photolyase family protein [Bacillus mobilis]SME52872.1 Deoxyribodipyrimidine photo-lyase [Bacillus mobilis]HDR7518031.1 deoxyribodipyrimidine photo-lyase [Bacillus mobilis]